jgi:hypothetical protein
MGKRKNVQAREPILVDRAALNEPSQPPPSAGDEQALYQILEATGYVPADFDRSIFWRDIVDCMQMYYLVPALSSRKTKKEEINRLQKFKDQATKLQRLLADDNTWVLLKSSARRIGFDRGALKNLIEAVNSAPLSSDFFKSLVGGGSSFERLVSKDLRKVFEDHFHVKATIARMANGTPHGSYFSFVHQALEEFNITTNGRSYTPESIITAFYGKRTGRPRQKPTPRPLGKKRTARHRQKPVLRPLGKTD